MIAPQDISRFDRDGVVCLRKRFEAKWIESLARGFEGNLAAPGTYATSYTAEGNPGGYLDDLMNWNRIPEYRSFVLESPAARIAGELTGSATCRPFLENMLIKMRKEADGERGDLTRRGGDVPRIRNLGREKE